MECLFVFVVEHALADNAIWQFVAFAWLVANALFTKQAISAL